MTYPRNVHVAASFADRRGLAELAVAEAQAAATAQADPHSDEAWAALTAARQATSAAAGAYDTRALPDL